MRHWGYPAHFICADRCRFHLTTTVDSPGGASWCVSTLGDLRLLHNDPNPEPIGSSYPKPDFYECAIGPWEPCSQEDCNHPVLIVSDPRFQIVRRFKDAKEATFFHEDICAYLARNDDLHDFTG